MFYFCGNGSCVIAFCFHIVFGLSLYSSKGTGNFKLKTGLYENFVGKLINHGFKGIISKQTNFPLIFVSFDCAEEMFHMVFFAKGSLWTSMFFVAF